MTTVALAPTWAAAQARAPAWLPAETPTRPRSRASSGRVSSRFRAPRALNEPVFWTASSFTTTCAPVRPSRVAEVRTGVRCTLPAIRAAADRTASAFTLTEPVGVAVGVLERGPPAPELLRRLLGELHAAPGQLLVGGEDVVAVEQHVGEGADAVLLAVGGEQHQDHAAVGRGHLDPAGGAGAPPHRRVLQELEAEGVGEELLGAVLVAHVDADAAHGAEHDGPPRKSGGASRSCCRGIPGESKTNRPAFP